MALAQKQREYRKRDFKAGKFASRTLHIAPQHMKSLMAIKNRP